MIKFYKSFLFIFVWNALFLILTAGLMDLRFLIPAVVCLIFFNLFLCFFIDFYIQKHHDFSALTIDDPYGASSLFEELKQKHQLKNTDLMKIKTLSPVCLSWVKGKMSYLVVSEDILDNLSKEDLACFISSVFEKIKSGDLFFLTILSAFFFLVEKLLRILSYPLLFRRKNQSPWSLKTLSAISKNTLYLCDKSYDRKNTTNKYNQALFLWKLNSFLHLKPVKIPIFLALLLPIHPDDSRKSSLFSHLPVKKRIKSLAGSYPP